MKNPETFTQITISCDDGKIKNAQVFIPENKPKHGMNSFVTEICPGCKYWTTNGIKKIETKLKIKWGNESGIVNNRPKLLNQVIVDPSRWRNDNKHILTVTLCTPIT